MNAEWTQAEVQVARVVARILGLPEEVALSEEERQKVVALVRYILDDFAPVRNLITDPDEHLELLNLRQFQEDTLAVQTREHEEVVRLRSETHLLHAHLDDLRRLTKLAKRVGVAE